MGMMIISGSPRKDGNTDLLLSILDLELQKNNISTEFISLSDKKINHCTNCEKCNGINKCIQNDDFNNLYNKILNNKGIVIGSPVYVGAPTSLIMAFIQRLTYVSFNNSNTLSKKIGGPIAVGGENGQLTTINCLVDFYLVNEMIIPGSTYWNIGVGVHKGDIEKDEKGKSYIKRFAQNLAWLMKEIEE
ncbi:flavodoxin family protein [Clostridium thailandense]|uniref:flavodoxin family protein n=1 Tax=Clostridium thailandense TaxID=2794346 RepID=UPI0039898C95